MGLYRIYETGVATPVGVIVAKNKAVAEAYAQGKYGASSSVQLVNWKQVLEQGQVCVVIETHEKSTGLHGTIRVIT
jgi:hypothetical protein